MIILGINAYHGDAAAALVKDGRLVAAVEEERFNRFKHCAGFPVEAIRYCLKEAGVTVEDLDHVGVSRDPSAHLHKKILFAATRAAKAGVRRDVNANVAVLEDEPGGGNGHQSNGGGVFRQIKDRLGNAARIRDVKDELARQLLTSKNKIRAHFHNIEHHRAHLASAFFVSPFEEAALLSIDGFGDFISTMWASGKRNSIEVLGQVEYPHS
ncbi:MAG TPA: carbamoyltransferase N-terminal domain-containing protein, partial [Pyrinomonadaceae bacterium]